MCVLGGNIVYDGLEACGGGGVRAHMRARVRWGVVLAYVRAGGRMGCGTGRNLYMI